MTTTNIKTASDFTTEALRIFIRNRRAALRALTPGTALHTAVKAQIVEMTAVIDARLGL